MSISTDILYVNKSNNQNHPEVLVFMEPVSADLKAHSTAWQIIRNIGYNCWHGFTYTLDTKVAVTWDHGKSGTFPIDVVNGKKYTFSEGATGYTLENSGSIDASNEFDVINKVNEVGGVSVVAYKDGNPIATKEVVARNSKAEFVIHPKLYLGVSSEYEVGQVVDSAVMSEEFTKIDLEGLKSVTVELHGSAQEGYTFTTSSVPAG